MAAKKLGVADLMFKNIKVEKAAAEATRRYILREMNRGILEHRIHRPVAGAVQAAHGEPEGLRPRHAARQDGPCKGDYYGLPWPCWGKPEVKHPGTAPFSITRGLPRWTADSFPGAVWA